MKTLSLTFLPLALLASAALAQTSGFSDAERRQGAEAHPQLLKQFGGAYQGPQADYVRRVGQKIALQSGYAARGQDYTVTLLNSNANNAFAIPGGYIYITRQLLALMNDEAELAFVMGHEVGHVAAQHSQKRQSRSTLTGLGAAILGAVTGSNIIGNIANAGAQIYTLGYSRGQENESDDLGVRYLARAGYDPLASADILAALGAQTSLEARLAGKGDEASGPSWLSTHPTSASRVQRVRKEAAKVAASAGPRAINRDAFLDAINGMPYDDDVEQGIIDGQNFRHGGLKLSFTAPAGFSLQNSPSAVLGTRGSQFRFQFSGGRPNGGESLASYAGRVWEGAGVQNAPRVEIRRINGLEVGVSSVRSRSNNGEVDAQLAVYRWGNDAWYHLLMLAPAGQDPGYASLINSVRRLTPQEANAIKGRRVTVITVKAGDTVQGLASRMAYDDDRLARFTILNGITANARLVPGSRIKLITRG